MLPIMKSILESKSFSQELDSNNPYIFPKKRSAILSLKAMDEGDPQKTISVRTIVLARS